MPKTFYCLKCSTAKWGRIYERPFQQGRSYPHLFKYYYKLQRVYVRKYKPAGLIAIGWYCDNCGNFIKKF